MSSHPVDDGGRDSIASTVVTASQKAELRRRAARTKTSVSAVIDSMIERELREDAAKTANA